MTDDLARTGGAATSDGMPHSLTVTDDLVRAMTRDVTSVMLRSRQMAVVWVSFGVLVVAALVVVAVGDDPGLGLTVVVMAPLLLGVLVLSTRRSVRRALTAALPPGTDVSLAVTDEGLQQRNALGASQTTWSAFRDLRVRGAAAVLRMHGSSAFVVLPSALLTDADRDALRARLG